MYVPILFQTVKIKNHFLVLSKIIAFYIFHCFLRPFPQRMSTRAKNFEIEISAWGDTPSSALSEMALFFLQRLVLGQNFR